ncbi:MAG: helix-turn-helix domain-containing protein [Bacteriovoracales bacterium]|nr:helix-turn-helix domain-containing protein [Bacteriovoracales bacterium]
MPKKKISKKRIALKKDTRNFKKNYAQASLKVLERDDAKLKKFDYQKTFKEMGPEDLFEILFEIWMDRDIESFKSVLATYLDIHNKQKIAKTMGVSRNTLYHMISEDGNPTLDTLFKLFDAIEFEAA